eukprot:8079835-Pyramimonas_sp.AAC.1
MVKGLLVNSALTGMEVWAKSNGPLLPRDLSGLERFIVGKCGAILEGTCEWSSGHAKTLSSHEVLK